MDFTVTRPRSNVAVVDLPFEGKFKWWCLLTADRHWDNPFSDRKMQKRHLKLAQARGAGIIDIGDLFCGMQGKWDGRSNKEALRPEHMRDDYYDALVETAADFFAPFAENFITMGEGNHETGILKRHEINMITRLTDELNHREDTNLCNGGYSGWVILRFPTTTYKIWYIHGYGGGGPVTKGVIQSNRRATYLPDADIVLTGHIHEDWGLKIPRVRCTNEGDVFHDVQHHIQLPTYKDEYRDGKGGFHIETGKPPKPIGATWLKFHSNGRSRVGFDVIEAR